MDYHTVHKVISNIEVKNIDIDIKLRNYGEVMHLKLEKELDIR
jgi:hypothetical protein